MSAHTPGEWRYWPCKDGSYDSKNDYMQISAGERHVAQVRIASVTEADMRLIAAAPDLLDNLINAHDWLNGLEIVGDFENEAALVFALRDISAAIAKATGAAA